MGDGPDDCSDESVSEHAHAAIGRWRSAVRSGALLGASIAASTDRAKAASTGSESVQTDRRDPTAWSTARLSAAVDVIRGRRATANGRLFADEIDFFASNGTRHEVPSGMVLAERGQPARDVHLVERGAVAVFGAIERHRPILAIIMPDELCGAVPALLHQAAPWDTAAITDSSVVTVPADRFVSAVLDRWADRWSTRTLSWLAAIGTRVADLDGIDLTAQVAALLLRQRDGSSVGIRCRTLVDLLDVDDDAIRRVLDDLRRLGAVRLHSGHVTVAQAHLLRAAAAAARAKPRPESTEGLPAADTDSRRRPLSIGPTAGTSEARSRAPWLAASRDCANDVGGRSEGAASRPPLRERRGRSQTPVRR